MKLRTMWMLIYLVALLGLGGVVVADDDGMVEKKSVYVVKSGEVGEIIIDSDEAGVHMDELGEGETRSWVTEDGSEISVSRADGSLLISRDGETIELDDIDHFGELASGAHAFAWSSEGGQEFHFGHGGFAFGDGGVTISSSEIIPDQARAEIKQVLKDYGVESEVRFFSFGDVSDLHTMMDHEVEIISEGKGAKRVKIIEHKNAGDG